MPICKMHYAVHIHVHVQDLMYMYNILNLRSICSVGKIKRKVSLHEGVQLEMLIYYQGCLNLIYNTIRRIRLPYKGIISQTPPFFN